MIKSFPIILLFSFGTIELTNALYENYTLFSIKGNYSLHEKLRSILTPEEIRHVEEPGIHKKGLMMSSSNQTAKLVKFLSDNKVNYTVITRNLKQYLNQRKTEDLSFRSGNVLHNYLTYDQIKEQLNEWSKLPGVSTRSIGNSVEEREIPMIQINVSPNKSAVILECGIHAREWISPATCLNFAYTMIKNSCESFKRVSLYIVPILNPDGYVKTHTDDRFHRKNCGQPHPVDLNRNFDAGWMESNITFSETYPGPKAFSEPETRAMKKLIESLGNQLIFYLSVHSYSQLLMFPYGHKDEHTKTHKMLDKIAERGAEILKCEPKTGCKRGEDSRYKYEYGTIADTIYTAYGSSVDWVYDSSKNGRKASFAIELPPDHNDPGFILPPEFISPVNKSFVPAMCAMIEERLGFLDKNNF